ncbi:MAG: CopD family protein, partial [Spirochaetia bacterium]|nr:CopD family protein [Spirochaetia bacterium]
ALGKNEPEKSIISRQLLLMARRLWYIITWPGMILTAVFGVLLIMAKPDVMQNGWFHVKLTLVLLLLIYHVNNGRMLQKLAKNELNMSSQMLRIYNELPTLFLFSIVFLVVLQNTMSLVFAFAGVFALGALLMLGITVYKKFRKGEV